MRLAQMLEVDEDAVICDLAETYGVLDCEALPITLVATLADGLPDSSRIMRKLSGAAYTFEETALAAILDAVNLLAWLKTEDARSGTNRPPSVIEAMKVAATPPDSLTFSNGEEFMKEREKYLERGGEDNGIS